MKQWELKAEEASQLLIHHLRIIGMRTGYNMDADSQREIESIVKLTVAAAVGAVAESMKAAEVKKK